MCPSFPVGIECRTCVVMILIPDNCLSYTLHIRALVGVLCGGPKSFPVHSFNALIIPILNNCLQSLFRFLYFLILYCQLAFVSRCTGTYFSFYGLVLDIAMNCWILLYRSLSQREFTYIMDYLIISITGINVAFLLTVSPISNSHEYHKQPDYFFIPC